MTKDQKTIKAQAQQIIDLEAKLKDKDADLKRTEEYRKEYEKELEDIHRTFDLLGVPQRVKNTYHDLTANARLTLFLAQTNGIKVEQPKEND